MNAMKDAACGICGKCSSKDNRFTVIYRGKSDLDGSDARRR